jgi:hypothetical protein
MKVANPNGIILWARASKSRTPWRCSTTCSFRGTACSCAGDVSRGNAVFEQTHLQSHTGHQTAIRGLAKYRLLAGLRVALARTVKTDGFLHVAEQLGASGIMPAIPPAPRRRSIGGTMRGRFFSPISQERSVRKRQRRRRANHVPQSASAHRRPALLPGRSTGRRRPKGRARSPRCDFGCNLSIPSGAKKWTP